jgi:nicotinate-nucleotide adenylyltransferase
MSDELRKKVGIMGGTFDPIHVGHLILGENAYQQFGLDQILFMPSGNPPHKKEREGMASAKERVDMVSIAIADNPHFQLSLAEAYETGYTYTKETLTRLTEENPDTDYYFIMGADSLFDFEKWKEPQGICNLCTILAAVRNNVDMDAMDAQIAYLEGKYHGRIEKLDTPNVEISSGELRHHIAMKRSLRYYMPKGVADYIREHQLYRG